MTVTASQRDFIENVLAIGDDESLTTIATVPCEPRGTRAAWIALNAGVLHRIGPHRLHVTLARRLASLGFSVYRTDLSGIGDSRAIAGHSSFRDSAVADTRAIMDHLVSNGTANRFVIFGLCSGADNALAAATADTRIAGLVLIDPPAYSTFRSRVRKLAGRALRTPLEFVLAAIPALVRKARLRLSVRTDRRPSPGRQSPPQRQYREQLLSLLARGTSILCVYSGSLHERYNHADQLFEVFPELRGRVEVEYFAHADHIFTESDARGRLIDLVCSWATRTFA